MSAGWQLSGRHALITGGGSGIGLAVAERLSEAGCRLTLIGRDLQKLQDARGRLTAEVAVVAADIAEPEAVSAAVAEARERHGPVEILINNAGIAESAPFPKTSLELWRRSLEVNLTGTYLCSRAVIEDMLAAAAGRIVNIASTAGLIGYPYVAAYCAAKHGVVGLTRALAIEFARKGFTVNAVCPGYTETAIIERAVQSIVEKTDRSEQEARARLLERNPQGRLIRPEEVAATVLWLCSGEAGSINGQAIAIAGGEVM